MYVSANQKAVSLNLHRYTAGDAPGAAEGGGTGGGRGGRVHAYSLGKARAVERLAKTATPPTLVSSPRGTFLGAFERHTVMLWSLAHKEGGAASTVGA